MPSLVILSHVASIFFRKLRHHERIFTIFSNHASKKVTLGQELYHSFKSLEHNKNTLCELAATFTAIMVKLSHASLFTPVTSNGISFDSIKEFAFDNFFFASLILSK